MMRKKGIDKVFINHALRVSLFIATLFILILIFAYGIKPYKAEFREGDVALKDIYAPFDFVYYGEIDEKATQGLKERAQASVRAVYNYDENSRQALLAYVDGFLSELGVLKAESASEEERLSKLKKKFPGLKEASLSALSGVEDLNKFKADIYNLVQEINYKPIITKQEKEFLDSEKRKEVVVRDLKDKREDVLKSDELILASEADRVLLPDLTNKYFQSDTKLKSAVQDLLAGGISPNAVIDKEEYYRRVGEERKKVPPVLKAVDVKKDELIIEKGERVTKQHVQEMGKILNMEVGEREIFGLPLSMAMIILILLVITVISLKRYEPKAYNNNSYLLLIAIVAIMFLGAARLITVSFLSAYFIPIASASMLLAILLGENTAFLTTLMLSIGCGMIVGNRLETMVICLAGGALGIYAVRGLRKRSQLLLAGILVGSANFIMISSFGVLTNLSVDIFLIEGLKGVLNGIISSFIVMGLLPLFEFLFKITTNITLLELSDLNHPLLKALTLKAPGTYHHSLIVGNLAEAACDAIGANSLLARIGAYYHDIGKLEKPEYFTENIVENKSRHDELSPSMSALIITNHVKYGVELAKKYKLNKAITDFIEQHHGNTLIYYFYQRALETVSDDTQLNDQDFRYPGPRPQTKEAAIVLLADAVEASSRTLSNPTPARIEGLVRKIINNKFIDDQLSECELTLKDLNRIAEGFVRVLTGIFHSRVEYPGREDKAARDKNRDKENNKANNAKQGLPEKDSQSHS